MSAGNRGRRSVALPTDDSVQCKRCEATVTDSKDETFAAAKWGWTMAPDPGLGDDISETIPGYFYACPDCSDDDCKDAFRFAAKPVKRRGK